MSKARRIIEGLFEGSAPVAPSPATKPVPKSPGPLKPKPGSAPKHDPWRRREIKPGTAPKPKAFACAVGKSDEGEMSESKKSGKGKPVAKSPGKVSYGKKSVKESLARRLLEA